MGECWEAQLATANIKRVYTERGREAERPRCY